MPELLQDWVKALPLMQQTVLLTAIRGPDGLNKTDPCRQVVYAIRRCVLISAIPGAALSLSEYGGGEFMPPIYDLPTALHNFYTSHDHVSHHAIMHIIHACEIIGYKYSVEVGQPINVKAHFRRFYKQMSQAMHMEPETEEYMDRRLDC